jgi:molybdenum cofactor guanylyltransferase/molybdopterin-guanine dinucleotide biosynthesis protein MobB
MIPNTHIIGVVLAGGLSRRMGGGDKGLLPLAGSNMLGQVVERLRPQVAGIVINANGDPGRFASLGLPVVADTVDGFVGPLAGVLAGLIWAAANAPEATHVATVSSDAPLFPGDLVERLAVALDGTGGRIAMARSLGELHPVIGLWPIALADDLEAALRDGVRKVLRWTDRHGTVAVDFEPVPLGGRAVDPFFNANTPQDLAELRRLLADATPPPAARLPCPYPVVGIAGWKNSGKTTLAVRLIAEFTRRGVKVSTIKHAHHDFRIDDGSTDSALHRQAGAGEVTIVSSGRWARVHELAGEPEPTLAEILASLSPADLVIVEGYKREAIPKIEARRRDAREHTSLADADPHVIAIAADHPIEHSRVPVLALDDITAIADCIERAVGPIRRSRT